ncbi:hypothetical protein [Butyrivibrio sp. AE2015]|uniref:hypothetical protein n=1 Tax=Butyrivibrio sp. AE2015 TaxID=1280663 RepID=UPI00041133D6|nr:hypothetical protein [Butyrivibrio sp. AE2015]
MAINHKRLCMNCGRSFMPRDGSGVFCSASCKKMYCYHTTFRCIDCRNASCTVRNNALINAPCNCENLLNKNRVG